MPRPDAPGRNDQGQGVYGVRTGTAWDAIWPALARFTNSAATFARSYSHGILLFGVSHDTDLGPKKRKRFIAAGGQINPPGVKHKRGSPVYIWQGEQIGKRRAFKIVHQIKHGNIPATPPLPPPPVIVPGNGGSVADQPFTGFTDYGIAAHYGPRGRFKRKKKKKLKLRSAAALLAATARTGLQYGEEVFADLLGNARGAVRYVEPLFDKLVKKGPMSDFERLLFDKPYRAPAVDVAPIARAAVSVAARAAGAAALLLWPSSIGSEPPWAPPSARVGVRTRPGRRPQRVPRPKAPFALPASWPESTMPRPQPRPESRPFPLPTSNPQRLPDGLPSPVSAPAPAAAPLPSPSPSPLPAPIAAPLPNPLASFGTWLSPLTAGFSAPGISPRTRPRVVAWPQQMPRPLTQPKPAPAESSCDCSKPTRTKSERKKRCTNPVIERTRKGDLVTITRRITCPGSSRRKPA